jgi:hypothetical protein
MEPESKHIISRRPIYDQIANSSSTTWLHNLKKTLDPISKGDLVRLIGMRLFDLGESSNTEQTDTNQSDTDRTPVPFPIDKFCVWIEPKFTELYGREPTEKFINTLHQDRRLADEFADLWKRYKTFLTQLGFDSTGDLINFVRRNSTKSVADIGILTQLINSDFFTEQEKARVHKRISVLSSGPKRLKSYDDDAGDDRGDDTGDAAVGEEE